MGNHPINGSYLYGEELQRIAQVDGEEELTAVDLNTCKADSTACTVPGLAPLDFSRITATPEGIRGFLATAGRYQTALNDRTERSQAVNFGGLEQSKGTFFILGILGIAVGGFGVHKRIKGGWPIAIIGLGLVVVSTVIAIVNSYRLQLIEKDFKIKVLESGYTRLPRQNNKITP